MLFAILATGLLSAMPVHAAGLSHGPIIGDVAPDHVQVWGRTTGAGAGCGGGCRSRVCRFPGRPPRSATIAESDFTFSFQIPGLAADTVYGYRVLVDGVPVGGRYISHGSAQWRPRRARGRVRLGCVFLGVLHRMGGGAMRRHPMGSSSSAISTIPIRRRTRSMRPAYLKKLRDMHRRLRGPETPIGRDFLAHMVAHDVPLLGRMLDDHDSGSDNVDSRFKWWGPNLQAFLEYHPVPADNGSPQAACGRQSSADARSSSCSTCAAIAYRPERRPSSATCRRRGSRPSLSSARPIRTITWCVIVSTVPYNPNQQKLDSWHGFPSDSQWLRDQIAAKQVRNVLVVSGDCHWGSIVLPPLSPLAELNIPQANEGFSNTCNNNAGQWTLNSAAAGTGFGLLTLRRMKRCSKSTTRTGRVDLAPGFRKRDPADRPDGDGDGVPDNMDECPGVPGVAPTGCPASPPGGGDVTMTFTRIDNGGQRYDVSVSAVHLCAPHRRHEPPPDHQGHGWRGGTCSRALR